MDADRFDTLARSLHALTTRRTALVAGVSAALATLLGMENAAGACKAQGAKCKKAGNCCSNYCRKFSKKKKKCWCKRLGETCASASTCCQIPSMVCEELDPFCADGNRCCIPLGSGQCTQDCDCCGAATRCNGTGVCESCREDGDECVDNEECCSGNICDEEEGECRPG